MPNPSKRKGDYGELECTALLADLTGWPVRRRYGAGRLEDEGDTWAVPETTLQIKNYTNINRAVSVGLPQLRRQQTNAGTPFAALLVRRHGKKEWVAIMGLDQFATLLREATTPLEATG